MKWLLLLLPVMAFAADYPRDITLSWDNATEYEDGSLLAPGELASVHLSCTRQSDAAPVFTATIPANGEGLYQVETFIGVVPQPGTYTCVGYSISDQDIWSLPSNEALKKYTGKPRAMTNFKFEAS